MVVQVVHSTGVLCPGKEESRGSPNHELQCGVCFCPEKEALFSELTPRCRMGQHATAHVHKKFICMYISHFSMVTSDIRSHTEASPGLWTGSSPGLFGLSPGDRRAASLLQATRANNRAWPESNLHLSFPPLGFSREAKTRNKRAIKSSEKLLVRTFD